VAQEGKFSAMTESNELVQNPAVRQGLTDREGNQAQPERLLRTKGAEAAPLVPDLVIAATFTAEPVLGPLEVILAQAGLDLNVRFAPYHQLFQELLSATSFLASNHGGINVLLVRIEDFIRDSTDFDKARTLIRTSAADFPKAFAQYARQTAAPTVLAVFSHSPTAPKALAAELQSTSDEIVKLARGLAGVAVLSPQELDFLPVADRYDSHSDELAHIPFTEAYYAELALAIARKVHALRVPAHKVLVLDCDNTLWRGVVGEDGIDGITIPAPLAQLQRFAMKAQAAGTLVCLVSKNAERDVIEVFEKRSDMVLKLEHIVAHRINWESKSRNLVSLARALNLGLDSFVFIDDNPVECALMRTELPQVVTLQLPPDDEIKGFLSHLWVFDKLIVTKEDIRRTDMYRENAARQAVEDSTSDIAEFITSLNVVTEISQPEGDDWPRLAQLTQRTNQFNLSTIRRSDPELRALPANGYLVLRVTVRDRFGDYGLVGLVIAKPAADVLVTDTLLLSCRVLGRGVEHAIMRKLGELATERALPYVQLCYVPTPKNEPARAFIDSIAARFRIQQRGEIFYRVPAAEAMATAHRPGQDPAAVLEARRSDEVKAVTANSSTVTASLPDIPRWVRYENLARQFSSGRDVLHAVRASRARARGLPGNPEQPATELERGLLSLWREILGIDTLGVEDDYYALGGTSLNAARMFAEIVRRYQIKLPLTAILDAPTVRTLARQLEKKQVGGNEFVELKRGGPRTFFLVHDGDGETLLYLNWARRVPADLAVFGIEPRRLPGVPLAHCCIEDMAAFYIEKIRQRQSRGPYLLGGMCAGGVIAYEMALQLRQSGESVNLVAVLDAAAPQAQTRAGRVTIRLGRIMQAVTDARLNRRSYVERACSLLTVISSKFANALTWEVKERWTRLSVRLRFRLLRILLARQRPWPNLLRELSVREIYDSAEAHYATRTLSDVPVILVRARNGAGGDTPYREIYADDALGWGALAQNLTVLDVNGGHASMLQEAFVESLAEALMPYLSGERETARRALDVANHRPTDRFVPKDLAMSS
jgi:FkbH-like protein